MALLGCPEDRFRQTQTKPVLRTEKLNLLSPNCPAFSRQIEPASGTQQTGARHILLLTQMYTGSLSDSTGIRGNTPEEPGA